MPRPNFKKFYRAAIVPDGYTIISAISDSKKTTAKMMVMRSRFF